MELELSGKRALVTGSSRGIGRAIAEALQAEGCRVAVNARNAYELQRSANAIGAEVAIAGDVSDVIQARRVVNETVLELGGLDILVCNVGSGSSVIPGDETQEEWQRVFALNLWSTTNTVEAALEALIASQGVIVCVSSICGLEVVAGAPVTYSAAKAALHAYVRGISRPFGKKGVRINAVAPGNIFFEDSVWARKLTENSSAVNTVIEREVALARFGTLRDIADLVAYLASIRSSFATGAVYTLDGGQVRS